MTDFEKQVKEALPCTCRLDFHSIYCPAPYGVGIVALLKAVDTDARRQTWEKAAQIADKHPDTLASVGLPGSGTFHAVSQIAAILRAEAEKEKKP